MVIMDNFHSIVGNKLQEGPTPVDDPSAMQIRADDKEAGKIGMNEVPLPDKSDMKPSENAQSGVKKIEAVTISWSRGSMFAVLILYVLPLCYLSRAESNRIRIWFLTLVNNMRASIVLSLSPYATSSFQGHSLLTVITIVASTITSAVYIPMAKALEGFLLMVCFCVLGMIILAASHNITTYCAGQVFYSVGFSGLAYTWDVLAADVTNLQNRGLAFAFTSSPALISAFAGSKAAAEFLENVNNWRWGYGIWTIILPVFALPIYFMLAFNLRKAERQGVIIREGKKWRFDLESLWRVVTEFDRKSLPIPSDETS